MYVLELEVPTIRQYTLNHLLEEFSWLAFHSNNMVYYKERGSLELGEPTHTLVPCWMPKPLLASKERGVYALVRPSRTVATTRLILITPNFHTNTTNPPRRGKGHVILVAPRSMCHGM